MIIFLSLYLRSINKNFQNHQAPYIQRRNQFSVKIGIITNNNSQQQRQEPSQSSINGLNFQATTQESTQNTLRSDQYSASRSDLLDRLLDRSASYYNASLTRSTSFIGTIGQKQVFGKAALYDLFNSSKAKSYSTAVINRLLLRGRSGIVETENEELLLLKGTAPVVELALESDEERKRQEALSTVGTSKGKSKSKLLRKILGQYDLYEITDITNFEDTQAIGSSLALGRQ